MPESVGPVLNDGDEIVYTYHSDVDFVGDSMAGLVGPLIISKVNATSM